MAFEVTQVINRDSRLWQTLRALPKIELHRHLEGAIRIQSLIEIAEENNIPLPSYDLDVLRSYVQMTQEDAATTEQFLTKFKVLRQLFISEKVIRQVARAVVEDAAEDNIRYMELRFTPYAQAKLMDFSFYDVVNWVSDAVTQAAHDFGIRVNLIIAMNRHESVEIGYEMFQTALDFMDRGVVGLDLCGNEASHPQAKPFIDIFREAHRAGLGVTVHAGEWNGPENVRYAIEEIGTRRIGHGVRTVEDSDILQLAIDNDIYFEICPTSNMQTGVVSHIQHHPLIDLYFLKGNITINTDDPAIHNVSLTDEYALLVQGMRLPLSSIKNALFNSINCAFINKVERNQLEAEFQIACQELDGMIRETEY